MNVKDIDKELKSLQKRLERYGKYEGVYLNKKYYQLISEAENIKYRIKTKDEDLTPQRVTGLIRRIKGIQKSKVTEFFNIYDPETDTTYDISEAPYTSFVIEEAPQIFTEPPIETIERIKSKRGKKPTEEFIPEPIPEQEEIWVKDAVLDRVWDILASYDIGIWKWCMDKIDEYIDEFGTESVAKTFEEKAYNYGASGDMTYDEARALYYEMDIWDYEMNLEDNKLVTSYMDFYEAEEI